MALIKDSRGVRHGVRRLSHSKRDAGAKDVWIDVDCDKQGRALSVHVQDNGPGANPRDLLQIISVSRSSKKSNATQGGDAGTGPSSATNCIGGFGFGLKGGIFKLGSTGRLHAWGPA